MEIRTSIDFIIRALNELIYYEPNSDTLQQVVSFASYLITHKVKTYNADHISPDKVERVELTLDFVEAFQLYSQLIFHYGNKRSTAILEKDFEWAARIRDKSNRIKHERQQLLENHGLREGFNRVVNQVIIINSTNDHAQIHLNHFGMEMIAARKGY